MELSRTSAEHWIDGHAEALYRIAASRLRSREAAEEAVQETLLAALRSKRTFRGDSTERTWLVGIMKHKIADELRASDRRRRVSALDEEPRYFDERGRWLRPPREFTVDQEDLVQKQEFWAQVRACLEDLPPRQAAVFLARTVEEEDLEVTCNGMEVSTTNYWVLVHRARLGLRACLEKRWFLSSENET